MRNGHRYLRWDEDPSLILEVRKLLDSAGIRYSYKHDPTGIIPSHRHELDLILYEDRAGWRELKAVLDQMGFLCQSATYYDKKDHRQAEWFVAQPVQVLYPQPDAAFGYLAASFDLSHHCPSCGQGKIQDRPFRLKNQAKAKDRPFWGLFWENDALFVSNATAAALGASAISGFGTRPALAHRDGTVIPEFLQLVIDATLPPALVPGTAAEVVCASQNIEGVRNASVPTCGRIKYQHPILGGYRFGDDAFNGAPDLVLSHEYFGSGASAHRLIIASKKFRTTVENLGLKGLSFIPVIGTTP